MIHPLPTGRTGDDSSSQVTRTFIDDLLAEQRELTAVELFSRAHDHQELPAVRYRELLPATAPAPGQQYAFEVNLDQCSGCKACVSACHSLNGLDDDETWRSVGLLVGDPAEDVRARRGAAAVQQHVTTACHHCVDPACLNGCPVLAYDKDPITGIVRHLDDQCIGCQYCVMMCPYEVPQYSKARGIVRKCDMCSSRLAVGEAPACAQACPTSAIRITLVEPAKVRGQYRSLSVFNFQPTADGTGSRNDFLPTSPNPAITLPTTRFVMQRTLPENMWAVDDATLRRADSHWPLVLLLVLSQLAIGASCGALFLRPAQPLTWLALVAGAVAIVAGSAHLGQPLKAWRAFLGWRKSWFSREVLALGAFVAAAALTVGAHALPSYSHWGEWLAGATALTGLVTVGCSAMIYGATRRDLWSVGQSVTKFYGTTLLLGASATLTVIAFAHTPTAVMALPVGLLVAGMLVKLGFEHRIFRHLVDQGTHGQTQLNKTARLLAGELGLLVRSRIVCGLAGGVCFPLMALLQSARQAPWVPELAVASFGLCLAGEFIERYLFFTAVMPHQMPGGVAA